MSDPREEAHKFLMNRSAMYRLLHSPWQLAGVTVAALLLSIAILWSVP